MKVHVLTRKEDIDPRRLAGKVVVSPLRESAGPVHLSDSALAAALLYSHTRGLPHGHGHPLWQARVGQRMVEKAHEAELGYAARKSVLDVVSRMAGERLVRA